MPFAFRAFPKPQAPLPFAPALVKSVPTMLVFGGAATVVLGLSVGAPPSPRALDAPKFVSLERSSASGATISRRLSQRPVLRNRVSEAAAARRQPTGELTAVHLDRIDKTIEECMWFNS